MLITSTAIHSVEYYEEEMVLEIIFKHNPKLIYSYAEVEPGIAARFLAADSPGRFYQQNIKGFYPVTKFRQ